MFRKKKDKWDYVIRKVTFSDFELDLIFGVKNDVLMKVFSASMKKMKEKLEKEGKSVSDADLKCIEKFDVPENYHNLVKTFVKKPFNITSKEVDRIDSMKLLNYGVVKCVFTRNESEDWVIMIRVGGNYVNR